MKRIELNLLVSVVFMSVGIAAAVSIFVEGMPWWKYLSVPLPLIAISTAIFIFKKKITRKIISFIFLGCSLLSIIFGEHDNLSGVLFLFLAYSTYITPRFIVTSASVSFLTILATAIIKEWPMPSTIIFIIGYCGMLAITWAIYYPKERTVECDSLDYVTIGAIKMVIAGINRKEIADRLDITESGITKKLKSARDKMKARSNEELVLILAEKGHIGLK